MYFEYLISSGLLRNEHHSNYFKIIINIMLISMCFKNFIGSHFLSRLLSVKTKPIYILYSKLSTKFCVVTQ